MSDTTFGWHGTWRENFSVRSFEWVAYAWFAGAGAVWGALINPFIFGSEPSNALQWVALWPGWIDLQIRAQLSTTAYWNPILESSIIGAAGACAVAYMLLTISHIRE